MTCFAEWQPIYAAHGLATFPVHIDSTGKRPMVRNYLRAGRPYSDKLRKLFPDASAFGFALGARSKITVLDVDTKNEGVLADAMDRHGRSPLIVRSGSGNYQAWYRHSGERRHIRPFRDLPIDVLGAGYIVAPPSQGTKEHYQIIEGTLDDLCRLPRLRDFACETTEATAVPVGQRNNALFKHCMRHARACDDFGALYDVATTFVERCEQSPGAVLTPDEIRRVALSAWSYTQTGRNWVGAEHTDFDRSAFPPSSLLADPYLYGLLCWLRDHDGQGRSLMIADTLKDILGWSQYQLREARRRATEGAWLVLIEAPTRTRAARYAWGPAAIQHGLRNPEPMPIGGTRETGGSVYSHVWNPEAIHGAATDVAAGKQTAPSFRSAA